MDTQGPAENPDAALETDSPVRVELGEDGKWKVSDDGRWRMSWPEFEIEGSGETQRAAVFDFTAKLGAAAAADPAVAKALARFEPPAGSRPAPDIPADYQALPSVTAADFDLVVDDDVPVLVDFWAAWCRPCLAMAPTLVALQREFADRLRVVKVDVEAETDLMQRFDITAIPTLLLYRKGEQLHRITGAMGLDALRTELSPFIA